MSAAGLALRAVSRFYATPCFPPGAGPDYANAAVRVSTPESPEKILGLLHGIEQDFGRERKQRWGMRSLDLDLVAALHPLVLPDVATQMHWRDLPVADQMQAAPDRLILPHPRLQDRAFVLGPMCDIAPAWRHPVTGRSTMQMWAALHARDRADITPF